jgi:Fe2+ transport system protein FeoA
VRAVESSLADMVAGDRLIIDSMGPSELCMQALRLGISEGSEVTVVTKLPAGPVVVRSGLQEIAIGRRLAGRIGVRRAEERSSDGPL